MNGLPNISDDLKELIKLFLFHNVEFIVVGAHALAFHARPRFTEDLDLFLRRSRENAERVRIALNEFGFALTDDAVHRLAEDHRGMIVLGKKPNQVDLLNFLDGVDFQTAWDRALNGELSGEQVRYICLEDYIATKRASGRAKDFTDLDLLRQINGPLPGDE